MPTLQRSRLPLLQLVKNMHGMPPQLPTNHTKHLHELHSPELRLMFYYQRLLNLQRRQQCPLLSLAYRRSVPALRQEWVRNGRMYQV